VSAAAKPKRAILDYVAGNLQSLISHVPHATAIGMVVVDVRPDEAWIKIPYAENLVGNPETGVVHGGVITTLLDNVAGIAVMAALEEAISIATLDLRIDYMKPATPGREILSHAHCYKLTQNVAFARCVAYHDDPKDPIATAVGSFMLAANRSLPAVMSVES
jgi:uncharacterized protein (TIGR00369 family)